MKCYTCGAELVEVRKMDIPGFEHYPVVDCPNKCEEVSGMDKVKTWNYRILKHKDKKYGDWFGLHEVYYNEDGSINSYTQDAIAIGESAQEVRNVLRQMLEDANRYSVKEACFDEDDKSDNPS